MKPNLLLITSNFPFGKGEEFLEQEVYYLSKNFNKIIILTSTKGVKQLRKLPSNTTIKLLKLFKLRYVLNSVSLFAKLEFWREFFICLKSSRKIFLSFKKITAYYFKTKLISEYLSREFKNENIDVAYSYWSNEAAVALTYNKNIFKKIVCRAHRYDLYAKSNDLNYIPFRNKLITKMDNIFFISQHGKQYFCNKYKIKDEKFKVSRLGVKKQLDVINQIVICPKFIIASCSFIKPVKRLDLLIMALSLIHDVQIKWFHIGSGEKNYSAFIKSLAINKLNSKKNIKYKFIGYLPNKNVQKFYLENNVSFLINVSSSEGLPVSMMEAFATATPVIATNVGAVSEIVDDGKNGFLLKPEIKPKELANTIASLACIFEQDSKKVNSLKQSAFIKWRNEFDAEKNYKKFSKILAS